MESSTYILKKNETITCTLKRSLHDSERTYDCNLPIGKREFEDLEFPEDSVTYETYGNKNWWDATSDAIYWNHVLELKATRDMECKERGEGKFPILICDDV